MQLRVREHQWCRRCAQVLGDEDPAVQDRLPHERGQTRLDLLACCGSLSMTMMASSGLTTMGDENGPARCGERGRCGRGAGVPVRLMPSWSGRRESGSVRGVFADRDASGLLVDDGVIGSERGGQRM